MNFLTLNIDSRENSLTGAEVEDSSGDIAMLVEISPTGIEKRDFKNLASSDFICLKSSKQTINQYVFNAQNQRISSWST